MTTFPIQAIFNRGELAPRLHSRIDLEYFRMAYKYGENFVLTRHGGLMNRPGTKYIGALRNHAKTVRLLKFIFSRDQVYILEFGNVYIHLWALDGHVITDTAPITAITKANPGVVTYSGADIFSNGDRIMITGVVGMTEVNNAEFTIAAVDTATNKFELGVNTTTYGTRTSGGTISRIYKITTPYLESELDELQFTQNKDIIYIAHKNHAPAQLKRLSEVSWTLSDVVFVDGPYLPAPSGTVARVTSSANNSGGAATSVTDVEGGTTPTALFDGNESTSIVLGPVPNTIRYVYAAAKTLSSYIIVNGQDATSYDSRSPKNWIVQGANAAGGPWTTLDARSDELGWQRGEARYYKFYNITGYTHYQIKFSAMGSGSSSLQLTEFYWGQEGDYAGTLTLTFSSTDGVNNGAGFQSTDVGRHIRLFSSNDARWRWFKITAITSTTVVVGRMYGFCLRDDFNISEWQLGAFSVESGWPSAVSFYDNRLVWGRTNTDPLGVFMSQTDNYYSHAINDPIVADDAITIRLASDVAEEILWMREGSNDLICGTSLSIRTVGKGDPGKSLAFDNFQASRASTEGSAPITPVSVESTLIYVDFHTKALREFTYDFQINAYVSPEVSILSDHLLKSGIRDMAFASSPEPILWIVTNIGELIGLTYDRENKVVGLHRHRILGSTTETPAHAVVEAVCVIPGLVQDDVWIVVRRTVSGATYRSVERITDFFADTEDKLNAWFLDGAFKYVGVSTNTITGLPWLKDSTVGVFANGTVYANLLVTTGGSVTLPAGITVTSALVGLPYTPVLDLLQPVTETQEGITYNRKKQSTRMFLDLYRTWGLKAGNPRAQERLQFPENGVRTEFPTELYTGYLKVNYDSRWEDKASVRIIQDKPYPAYIRSVVLVHEGET